MKFYVKDADYTRPVDPQFYLLAEDGIYFCRTHKWFESDVKMEKFSSLAEHASRCWVRYPILPAPMVGQIVSFFRWAFAEYKSEAIVLMAWDNKAQQYRLVCPHQTVSYGVMHVEYKPQAMPPGCVLLGDCHSHCDGTAFASGTDTHDEEYSDGVHVIIGCVNSKNLDYHVDACIDNTRFTFKIEHIFAPFDPQYGTFPEEWKGLVEVKPKESWAGKIKGKVREWWDDEYDDRPGPQGRDYSHRPYQKKVRKFNPATREWETV